MREETPLKQRPFWLGRGPHLVALPPEELKKHLRVMMTGCDGIASTFLPSMTGGNRTTTKRCGGDRKWASLTEERVGLILYVPALM